MPNLKAKLVSTGRHEITSVETGEVIGNMQLVGGRWWINGIPYSHSFLASLAEFEEEHFLSPSPVSDMQLLAYSSLLLVAALAVGGLIMWGFA